MDAIFTTPTRANIKFSDIEKLLVSLGAIRVEGDGSRVSFELNERQTFAHRPHPNKEAKKYQLKRLESF